MPDRFRDREEAGRLLATLLAAAVRPPCVVAGIPRGGLAVGLPIAERLGAPLAVAEVRKLSSPGDPEFAFGALDEDGEAILDEEAIRSLSLRPDEIERVRVGVGAEIERRKRLHEARALRDYLPRAAVVLVDDGLATGLTMRSALAYVRRHGARGAIVAAPCASGAAARHFQCEADRFVCPVVDERFLAVGAYYEDFLPVTDDQVAAILRRGGRIATPDRARDPEP